MTVNAKGVPHGRLLAALASHLKFELIITGPLEERRSLEIEGRPWEEALKKALSPASWSFVYASSKGQLRLVKVFVFPPKDDGYSPGILAPSPNHVASSVTTLIPVRMPQGHIAPYDAEEDIDTSVAELLEAEDGEMRALAVVALATMEGERPITVLTQVLQDEESWIRETAVEALAEIGGQQAIQGLRKALDDEDEDVRKAAQEALIRLQPNL